MSDYDIPHHCHPTADGAMLISSQPVSQIGSARTVTNFHLHLGLKTAGHPVRIGSFGIGGAANPQKIFFLKIKIFLKAFLSAKKIIRKVSFLATAESLVGFHFYPSDST